MKDYLQLTTISTFTNLSTKGVLEKKSKSSIWVALTSHKYLHVPFSHAHKYAFTLELKLQRRYIDEIFCIVLRITLILNVTINDQL